jgi:hypothetical protein
VVLVAAASKRQGAVIFGYTRQLFMDVPSLRPLVVGEQGSEGRRRSRRRHDGAAKVSQGHPESAIRQIATHAVLG